MDYKKSNAPSTTITRNLSEVDESTGNIYESIVVVAKRANQIGAELKTELNSKLEEFASYSDNLEEVFENREQIDERLPKPTLIAMEEYLEGNVYYRGPESIIMD